MTDTAIKSPTMSMPVEGQVWYLKPDLKIDDNAREARIVDILRFEKDIYVIYVRLKRNTDADGLHIKSDKVAKMLVVDRFTHFYTSTKSD